MGAIKAERNRGGTLDSAGSPIVSRLRCDQTGTVYTTRVQRGLAREQTLTQHQLAIDVKHFAGDSSRLAKDPVHAAAQTPGIAVSQRRRDEGRRSVL